MTAPVTPPSTDGHGATAVEILKHPHTGKTFIAIDSLVDLVEGMLTSLPDNPQPDAAERVHGQRGILQLLADQFRPASSYDELKRTIADGDGSDVQARACRCGRLVVPAITIGGETFDVDVRPPLDRVNGKWVPLTGTRDGRVRVAAWTPQLGTSVPRINAHTCPTVDHHTATVDAAAASARELAAQEVYGLPDDERPPTREEIEREESGR